MPIFDAADLAADAVPSLPFGCTSTGAALFDTEAPRDPGDERSRLVAFAADPDRPRLAGQAGVGDVDVVIAGVGLPPALEPTATF